MNEQAIRVSATPIRLASYLIRFALAAGFISAVADRFGFWGPPGAEGVAWGNVKNYEDYVALLNWFVPVGLIPALGWIATIAEIIIAIGLLVGWKLRCFAMAAAILLCTFALAMCFALGPKPALDYSVFSAASAAMLLFATTDFTSSRPSATTIDVPKS